MMGRQSRMFRICCFTLCLLIFEGVGVSFERVGKTCCWFLASNIIIGMDVGTLIESGGCL